jgi:hypothetical protein
MPQDEHPLKAAKTGLQTKSASGSDANKTLAEAIQSPDQRLWEAFPAMLANAAEAGEFDLEAANAYLGENERKYLKLLIFVSLGLYDHLGLKLPWTKRLFGDFPARLTANFSDKVRLNSELELGPFRVQPESLKENFQKHFKKRDRTVRSSADAVEKLDLELAVSRLFTAKQKDLFLKKLRRKQMTKTEREYFSRVIKKKLQALANEDLHQLARKILE